MWQAHSPPVASSSARTPRRQLSTQFAKNKKANVKKPDATHAGRPLQPKIT